MWDPKAGALGLTRRAWPVAVLVAGGTLPVLRVLADPLHSLPGGIHTDVYKHVWSYWHTGQILADGTFPWTRYLNAPGGGYLLDVMFGPSLLLLPVTWVFGVIAAGNLWIWLSLVATGVCTWALCREVTGSDVGGVAAGLLAQTAPYLMSYPLYSGVHERLTVWAFPLILLGLLRLRDGRSCAWIPVLVATFALTAASCAIHGYVAALVCLFAAPMIVPLPADLRSRPDGWRPWRGPAIRVALTLGLFAVLMGLNFAWYRWGSYHPWTLSFQGAWAASPHGLPGSEGVATLPTLFLPSIVRATAASTTNDELYKISFIGLVPVVVALLGVLAARRGQRLRVVVAVATGLLLADLALGPTIGWHGRTHVNVPFHGLAGVLPYFGTRVTHWQLVAAFAPLAGVGIAALVGRPSRRWAQALLALVVVGAASVERARALPFPIPLPVASARISPVYDAVLPDGALVDVPRFWKDRELTPGQIFLAQTKHRRPIPITVNIHQTVWDNVVLLHNGLSGRWSAVAPALRRSGFRWVVVHRDWFLWPDEAEGCVQALGLVAGPPVAETDQEALFDLATLPVQPDPGLAWPPGQQRLSQRGRLPPGSQP